MQKNKCDICHNHDDFLICSNCLNKFLKQSKIYRENAIKEKHNLQNVILDIFNKHNDKFLFYKSISLKNLQINKLKNKITSINLRINNREEHINTLKNMIYSKTEKLKTFKIENYNLQKVEEIQVNTSSLRNRYVKKLGCIIFDKNILKMNNFIEIQTYVKPNMNQSVCTDFENIPNVLSSSTLYSNDILKINYDNFIHLRMDVLNSKSNVLKLNQYIYKLIYFMTYISYKLGIEFPFTVSIQKFTIYNKLNNLEYKLFLSDNIKENNYQDLMIGYTYLDYNLIHLKSFLNLIHFKNKDLKNFLNIESIIGETEEFTEINSNSENNNYLL